jgi:hypothetical protein
MIYLLFAGILVLLIATGYFVMSLLDLFLEKALRYVAKRLYRKQTQQAIAQTLNKSLG